MDILKMTVGECMKNAKVKAVVEKHIPQISNFPVMLFAKKSVGELIKMGMNKGLFTQSDADMMIKRINAELDKLG